MKKTFKIVTLLIVSLACVQVTYAKHKHKKHTTVKQTVEVNTDYKGEPVQMAPTQPVFIPGFYIGASIGESRVHDKKTPGLNDSVTQIGPGWSADLGYRFIEFYKVVLAAELGYTQYYHSSENTPGVNVATTEHFGSYAALVGQYPLFYNLSILGKLGVAYSYAKKVFTASGASKSANTYSGYYGLGVAYNVTPQAALNLQWARAHGNSRTGSNDLTSLGIIYSFA